jgi:hypothetical protein
MRRETPEERVRREQRELMQRLNAERDARLTTAQQNQMRMAGSPPMPKPQPAAVPQGTGPRTIPLGGMAGRAQASYGNRLAQIDAEIARATKGKPR